MNKRRVSRYLLKEKPDNFCVNITPGEVKKRRKVRKEQETYEMTERYHLYYTGTSYT